MVWYIFESNESLYRLKKFMFLKIFWTSSCHSLPPHWKTSHKTELFSLKVQEAVKNRVHSRKRDKLNAVLASLPKNTNKFQQCFCYYSKLNLQSFEVLSVFKEISSNFYSGNIDCCFHSHAEMLCRSTPIFSSFKLQSISKKTSEKIIK